MSGLKTLFLILLKRHHVSGHFHKLTDVIRGSLNK